MEEMITISKSKYDDMIKKVHRYECLLDAIRETEDEIENEVNSNSNYGYMYAHQSPTLIRENIIRSIAGNFISNCIIKYREDIVAK